MSEISETINDKYESVTEHIIKANGFLADRNKPDYENSIKESITAVETMCEIIIGQKTTLGDALNKLETEGCIIHKALKEAFQKMYGYASDAKGVRHAGPLSRFRTN